MYCTAVLFYYYSATDGLALVWELPLRSDLTSLQLPVAVALLPIARLEGATSHHHHLSRSDVLVDYSTHCVYTCSNEKKIR